MVSRWLRIEDFSDGPAEPEDAEEDVVEPMTIPPGVAGFYLLTAVSSVVRDSVGVTVNGKRRATTLRASSGNGTPLEGELVSNTIVRLRPGDVVRFPGAVKGTATKVS